MKTAPEARRYAIGDLASLAGVTRRTIRYYAQQGLLPRPFGRGRGRNYGEVHLRQLLRIKGLQEHGMTLDAVREVLAAEAGASAPLAGGHALGRIAPPTGVASVDASESATAALEVLEDAAHGASADPTDTFVLVCPPGPSYDAPPPEHATPPSPSRSRWTRIELAPGIELHVSGDHRLPPPGKIRELARFCVREFKQLARRSPS